MSLKARMCGLILLCAIISFAGVALFSIEPLRRTQALVLDDLGSEVAYLLADLVEFDELGQMKIESFAMSFRQFQLRPVESQNSRLKSSANLGVAILDANGKSVFASGLGSQLSSARVSKFEAPIYRGNHREGTIQLFKPPPTANEFSRQWLPEIFYTIIFWVIGFGGLLLLMQRWIFRPLTALQRKALEMAAGHPVSPQELPTPELQEIFKSLSNAREAVETKARKEEFVSGMVQEIKAPVSALLENIQLLKKNNSDDITSLAQKMAASCEQIHHVLFRAQDLARIESTRELSRKSEVRIDEVLQSVRQSLEERLAQAQIELGLNFPRGVVVKADPVLLESALKNVLENAIDFSEPHSKIELVIQEKRGTIEFIIRDEGAGVPDFALPFVFQRFYSLPRKHSQKKNAGLGLAFVREIVQLHNGKVYLNSPPNGRQHGTEVRMTLPR